MEEILAPLCILRSILREGRDKGRENYWQNMAVHHHMQKMDQADLLLRARSDTQGLAQFCRDP